MKHKNKDLIKFFKRQHGVARFSDVLKEGFHPDTLRMRVKEGKIKKIGHGLYQQTSFPVSQNPDLVTAVLQAPKAVVCLISALSFHEATNEIPHSVDLAIPQGSRANKINYPPVKFHRLSSAAWKAGIEEHKMSGHVVKIYSLAKTVADCFKFRNKIGMDVARSALKEAVLERKISPEEIMRFAKICRVHNIIKPILESIL